MSLLDQAAARIRALLSADTDQALVRARTSGEVLVERKIVPAARDRSAPLGLIVLLAFIVTCVVVFLGDRLGIREMARGGW